MEQPQENVFDRCARLATESNERLAAIKPVTGWGADCLLGKRPTEDGATNYHKTGIIWGKGGHLTGHYDKRLGEINGMIVWDYDEAKQPSKLSEWIVGRLCPECGQRKPLDSHHFHRNGYGKHGYYSLCRHCKRSANRERYAEKRNGNVRKYRNT
jgi:hypothetical protein